MAVVLVRNSYARLTSKYRFMGEALALTPDDIKSINWWLMYTLSIKNIFLCNHIRLRVVFIVPEVARIFKLENSIEECEKCVVTIISKAINSPNDFPDDKILDFYFQVCKAFLWPKRSFLVWGLFLFIACPFLSCSSLLYLEQGFTGPYYVYDRPFQSFLSIFKDPGVKFWLEERGHL